MDDIIYESDDSTLTLKTFSDDKASDFVLIGTRSGDKLMIATSIVRKQHVIEMINACRGKITPLFTNDELIATHEIDQIVAFLSERRDTLKQITKVGIFEIHGDYEQDVDDDEKDWEEVNNIVKMLSLYFLSQKP